MSTIVDQYCNKTSATVGVWFQGIASSFDTGTKGACDPTPPKYYYVALPATSLCSQGVAVYNPNSEVTLATSVWNVGPWVPLWNMSRGQVLEYRNRPFEASKGKSRSSLCVTNCGSTIKLMNDLGGSGTISNAI
ncbi:hypothetical protein [Paenibacillus thalictri]|nr:hypothetical protein [Paenibacillus thalictri]